MDILISVIILIVALALLYLSMKLTLKSKMMQGNQFVQSKNTSKAIDKMQTQEELEQEQRLLKNPRYRALRSAINAELAHYRSLSMSQLQAIFQASQSSKKVIEQDGRKIQIEVQAYIKSPSSIDLRISAYPKSFLGSMFTITEWPTFHS